MVLGIGWAPGLDRQDFASQTAVRRLSINLWPGANRGGNADAVRFHESQISIGLHPIDNSMT